jgi:3,4-dihydroxy-2-butanone 4-phosphate synthase
VHDPTGPASLVEPDSPVIDWREREVANEVRSRARNEWIETASTDYATIRPLEEYVCECSHPACASLLALTRLEYEGVRSEPTYFAIAVNHENPEIDRVVSENERFAVVEKFWEMARRMVRETDPRR